MKLLKRPIKIEPNFDGEFCLSDARRGMLVQITHLGQMEMKKRFLEFGFVCGAKFFVVSSAKHTMLVERGNTLLALDKQSAALIRTRLVNLNVQKQDGAKAKWKSGFWKILMPKRGEKK